ncbi:S41 family peptidase [Lawsonibacter sp. OA9]|uniref:S41 family peptidase n=1 Tax=Lawsonibacter sp. OA9 TaxID=2914163 RepID=UPI001F06DDCC|nr:S41 family peptidase [Lawsonibacter sp. OA9]MCH1980921.1 S41 family peptidase [Lawsonibacter sp. OA9]
MDLEKAEVEIPAVSYKMLQDEVGYIVIYQFTAVVPEQFQKACQLLTEQGIKRLIVDLRDNPGGLLTSVCDTLNSFMPKGLLVYTEDRNGNRTEHFSEGKTPLDIPLVVLVNQNSASSAEIFAGAVKDYGVGTLVGTTTYGKGIVQKTFGLNDGSVVKLTVSSYYTPNGINIHGTGIEPDVEVEQPEDATEDLQLEKALELICKE